VHVRLTCRLVCYRWFIGRERTQVRFTWIKPQVWRL